jgi:patatin-like phospholipase
VDQVTPRQRTPPRIAAFFTLVGVLKYGLLFSALLVYLPLTTSPHVPLHDMLGNLFSELSPFGVFFAAVFVFLAAWAVMIVEGLAVKDVEMRAAGRTRSLESETFRETAPKSPDRVLPLWAEELFTVPVTCRQFVLFTLVLSAPAVVVILLSVQAAQRAWALGAIMLAFVVAYALLVLAAAPAAVLDPTDPPLSGRWPGADALWNLLRRSRFQTFAILARSGCSSVARLLRIHYILDANGHINSPHLFAAMAALGFVLLWAGTGWLFYPSRLTAAAVAYVYISLLLFIWCFGALRFHLARLHISPLAAVGLVLLVGYAELDHRYQFSEPGGASVPRVDPIEVAAAAGDNLVVVAAAGGGSWASGWTARGLEQLVSNRPALRREIRVLSGVSGGSIGAAYFIDGLLRADAVTTVDATLHDVRVRSTASTLEAVAYGLAFRDLPRLVTGGFYNPHMDRGQLLEEEWARIAAAAIVGEHVGRRPEPRAGKRALRTLNTSIRDGSIPAPIFGATVMETGQRLMITPITFAPGGERALTLQEFLFAKSPPTPEPDLDLWTAARLSATFTYVSPPARSSLSTGSAQKEHLIDGGYYDNFGVTSALDWLTPVLEARKAGDRRLRFKRVLLIELSGVAEANPESVKPANGLTATLTGPTLTAFLALREGVATSRNRIDIDRFKRSWNAVLSGAVQIETVRFRPDAARTAGPLSWHLSSKDIDRLQAEWGPGTDPRGWRPSLRDEWLVVDGFLRGVSGPR